MKHGVKKPRKDYRNYSFHRTFGSTVPNFIQPDFDEDAGLTMPDQNMEGLPFACTGYTQSELCQDMDKSSYKPKYNYDKTLEMDGLEEGSPCDIHTSLKSTLVYGVTNIGTDEDAALHRRGAYYEVEKHSNDWFDSIRSAILTNPFRCSVSVITPWFACFQHTYGGIITGDFVTQPVPTIWHNWKISGQKTINGVPYLKAKTWQGKNYGDNGWCYFSRERFNRLMMIPGTTAFTLAPFDKNNIVRVKIGIIETIISYMTMLLKSLTAEKKSQ